jgi:hypothetical protein
MWQDRTLDLQMLKRKRNIWLALRMVIELLVRQGVIHSTIYVKSMAHISSCHLKSHGNLFTWLAIRWQLVCSPFTNYLHSSYPNICDGRNWWQVCELVKCPLFCIEKDRHTMIPSSCTWISTVIRLCSLKVFCHWELVSGQCFSMQILILRWNNLVAEMKPISIPWQLETRKSNINGPPWRAQQ